MHEILGVISQQQEVGCEDLCDCTATAIENSSQNTDLQIKQI